MSKSSNPLEDYVFSLSDDDFDNLLKAIDKRIGKQRYGYTTFEEAAIHYDRTPICPKCSSFLYHLDGKTNANHTRYRCDNRDTSYTLLSNSIFNGAKISLHKLVNYIELMSFNVPLELMCEVLNISTNTAELWCKKIFSTANDYQNKLVLSNNVWIDEIYVEDYEIEAISKGKHLRGLSKSKICIVVAIDSNKNMIATISGHTKPSSKRILKALKSHIRKSSNII